jgi:hypothetical protein
MLLYYTIAIDDLYPAYWPIIPADLPILIPASSYAGDGFPRPHVPPGTRPLAADSGGYVATLIWGDYRYTPDQYVAWLDTWCPDWAATMDYCCEDEITNGKPGIVIERQQRTSEMAYRFFCDYRAARWLWIPTIQGWQPEDYARHARELRPLVEEMKRHYGDQFRVGIGTLCHRASTSLIHQIVSLVADLLPDTGLHLWGVKLGALQSPQGLPRQVVSVDTAAWAYGRGRKQPKADRIARGMTQREYAYKVMLTDYRTKVDRAVNSPKQPPLPLWGE